MIRTFLYISLTLLPGFIQSQEPPGTWSDHLPYHTVRWVAGNEYEILGSTDFAISRYNREYNEIKKLSKVNGLTDCGISTIGYSPSAGAFVIAYSNTNIDILKDGIITNVPDILNKYIAGNKEILRIRTMEDYAFLATSFGIVVYDIERMEVHDTWKPSPDGEQNMVYDIAFMGGKVFAATGKGLFQALTDNPGLSYYGNWELVPGSTPGKIYNGVASLGDRLFINSPEDLPAGDILLMYHNDIFTPVSSIPSVKNHSLEASEDRLVVSSGTIVSIFNQAGIPEEEISDYGWGTPNAYNAFMVEDELFIADVDAGIVRSSDLVSFSSIIPPGPYLNLNHEIFCSQGSFFVSGGSVDNAWNNNFNPLVTSNYINRQWQTVIDYDSWDALRIRPYPLNRNRVFVSTWGSGLFEYTSGTMTAHWDDSNSPLQSIIPGEKYVRICGLAFDSDNNLWLTQTGVENSIKVLQPDGTWLVLPYTINAPTIGDILITMNGFKWIILPRGHGLFVLDDNHTPSNFSDDRTRQFIPIDQDGNPLPNIYSIEEDIEGNLWIGTDQGPAVFYNPGLFFDRETFSYRLKIPRNDGTGLADFLLGTETVTTISTDGGNRKWFGTNSSGAYLVSEDGYKLIHSYNSSNSPVLSDNITAIEVDGTTGEVWIGSSKGMVTIRENATTGTQGMDHVYAFPNPVREDFTGDVTITGLMENTNLKITDISGNLVYETTSLGGQATWDLNNYRGTRVSTGIYLVFCASEDGNITAITKLLVIR